MAQGTQSPLERIMSTLRKESLDQLPVAETSDRFAALAGDELERVKAQEDTGKLVATVKNWYTTCKNARITDERQWYKNIDMYQGRQFTEWDDRAQHMREAPKLSHDIRLAVNIIEPICRTEMAKTGAANPTATVSPASNDMDDILAAQAGEAVWEWLYATEKFQTRVFVPANWWRTITGNGFIKNYYDFGATDPAAVAAAEAAATAAASQNQGMGLPVMPATPTPVKGKISIDPVTPFNLFIPDMAEVDLQRQPYLIHAYTLPVEQARLTYAAQLPADWNPAPISSSTIIDITHLGVRGGNPAKPDAVLVMEAWIKPGFTPLMPEGGLITLVGDEVVGMFTKGIPYKHGEYPFAHLTGIESGRFYRKSVVESLTPLQNELNHTYSQIIKRKNLTSNPQFFYDEMSLDPRRVNNKPGQYIPIRLGMKYPQPVPITEVPAYVHDLIDRIKAHTDDISGQHQVSRAISPGADTAASALALLQETDDNFLSTTFDSIEAGTETIGRQSLSLAVQFWDEPRLVKVTGTDSAFDARVLKGADLTSGTDLRIDSGSGLPLGKSAKIATITEWIDKGIIPPEAGLEAMEMGTLGKVYQRIKLDRSQADRENIEMRDLDPAAVMAAMQPQVDPTTGQPPVQVDPATGMATPAPPPVVYPIKWMDNDAVHIQVHKDFAKSQSFASLPPEIQAVFEQHVAEHEMRLSEQMMMQASMNAPAEGAPNDAAGAPGAPGPQFADAI